MALTDPTAAVNPIPRLTLTERSGDRRVLVLSREALPYRPVRLGRTTRMSDESYQGNPDATHQKFGPKWDDVQLRGFWKDRWLAVTGTPIAWFAGVPITTARGLTEALDTLWMDGHELDLLWHVEKFRVSIRAWSPIWHRTQDVEWELTLAVIGQGDTDARAEYDEEFDFGKNAGGLLATMSGWLTAARGALQKVQALAAKYTATLDRIDALRKQLDATIGLATDVALLPLALASRTAQTAADLTQTWATMKRSVASGEAAVLSAGNGAADVLRAYGARADLVRACREGAASSARLGVLARRRSQPRIVKIVVATEATDLRRIALEVYGTQDGWIGIAEANGLTAPLVPSGFTVLGPEKTS